jgi:hypothetical protein
MIWRPALERNSCSRANRSGPSRASDLGAHRGVSDTNERDEAAETAPSDGREKSLEAASNIWAS